MLMLQGNMPFIGDVVVTLLIIVQIIFLSHPSSPSPRTLQRHQTFY
jgi:hypothetical protein